ncbi:MAG: glycosyltransferase family 39 protein [Microcoleaceae cyanobacterium]
MHSPAKPLKESLSPQLRSILIFAITMGIIFRFVALDNKVYGFDEVETNLRVGGWTCAGVDQALFQNQIIPARQLQQYQGIKPDSTVADTIYSLAVENPQHPPLYFLLARGWMLMCGSSITASRSLSMLLSLLSLPLMYLLAKILFNCHVTALLATTLLSISPVDLLFAQTARQYSLLTVLILASSYVLLQAIHSRNQLFWGLYIVSSILGLYTHLVFGLTLISHGAYILLIQLNSTTDSQQKSPNLLTQFMIAFTIILGCYLPWIITIFSYLNRTLSTTPLTTVPINFIEIVKSWILNFSAILIDTNLDINHYYNYLIRLPAIILILLSIYHISSKKSNSIRLFILTSISIPFLILLLPDILIGGRRSTIAQYLIPCFPGIQLAMSHLFYTGINSRRFSLVNHSKTGKLILIAFLTSSLISCTVIIFSWTWWTKGISYWNGEVAQQINTEKSPLIVTDEGDYGINKSNLISLSYRLNSDVELLLMNKAPNFYLLPINSAIFIYAPSQKLQQTMPPRYGQLEPVTESKQLWRLKQG